jgi:hypothetical protein
MVVLAVDLVMRLLLIEKKVASAYLASNEQISKDSQEETHGPQSERAYNSEQTENEALLPQKKADTTRSSQPTRVLPIVHCLTTKRLLVALGLGFVQALIIGTYDATLAILIEAAAQFGFSSLETGFLFSRHWSTQSPLCTAGLLIDMVLESWRLLLSFDCQAQYYPIDTRVLRYSL